MKGQSSRGFLPQKGWIRRQISRVDKEYETWPEWMKRGVEREWDKYKADQCDKKKNYENET